MKTQKQAMAPQMVGHKRSLKSMLVVAFVLFHLVVILDFSIPLDIWPSQRSREWLSPYMLCIGMNETWDTFAPRPKAAEQYIKAIVLTPSGNRKIYSLPRMEDMTWIERYQKERYRKFTESILCSDCSGLWPDIAKSVGRQESSLTDPPDMVILVKFESPIDPSTGSTGTDEQASHAAFAQFSLKPEDLQ